MANTKAIRLLRDSLTLSPLQKVVAFMCLPEAPNV
jgi:hypothetical protein